MAGEADHRDPAEIAAERREAVDRHIAKAQQAEEGSLDAVGTERLIFLAVANNHRLQALCIHSRLDDYIDGKDEA